jgi:hypothetical protein
MAGPQERPQHLEANAAAQAAPAYQDRSNLLFQALSSRAMAAERLRDEPRTTVAFLRTIPIRAGWIKWIVFHQSMSQVHRIRRAPASREGARNGGFARSFELHD